MGVAAGRMRSLSVTLPVGIAPSYREIDGLVGLVLDDESSDHTGQIRLAGADVFGVDPCTEQNHADYDRGD